ncbi:MAG: hypothetical protein Q9195_006550 [Heterodermia aff. obscurata]
MFSSLGLFKQVDCPESSHCLLPSCIFSHHRASTGSESHVDLDSTPDVDQASDGPRKRRKVSGPKYPIDGVQTAQPNITQTKSPLQSPPVAKGKVENSYSPTATAVGAATRPVSPPPLRGFKGGLGFEASKGASDSSKQKVIAPQQSASPQPPSRSTPAEALNPRMITNPPASHTTRLRLITMMHAEMARLNELVKTNSDTSKTTLKLTPQELIRMALDEEEKAAKKNPAVYANVLKLRIVALKRMAVSTWKEERLRTIEARLAKATPPKPVEQKTLDTGLTPDEEIAVLPKLLANQDGLAKHGYVTSQLSEAQIKVARDGVESSNNWESCDRCHTLFQVFPGRRAEDGALTTGGSCVHHPSRARRPAPKDKADKTDRESVYLCCNEVVGRSAGCTTAATHVFKVAEAKRLALILAFEETPGNEALDVRNTAVCFDCEMGYTTHGMELIRLTATSWPSGSVLLDTLVRPLGEVLDLNSRYSGVWPADYASALPFDSASSSTAANRDQKSLPIVSSPAEARSLLFNFISPTTPLIGHALENDLNATRIIHPCIIDTCLLYPHVRGLPMRHGLKYLMKKYLDKDIQVNSEGKGHDSAEDARSAGELVRVKIKETVARAGMGKDGKMVKEGLESKSLVL